MSIIQKRIKASFLKAFMTHVDKKRLKQQNYPLDDLNIQKKSLMFKMDIHSTGSIFYCKKNA